MRTNRATKAILLTLILLAIVLPPVLAINDYGEDEDYLGQVVDDYENAANIAAMTNTIHNETLDCMELNYSSFDTMIMQNFTDFTEVEEGTEFNTISEISLDMNIWRSMTSYMYYDFGVNGITDYKIYGKFRQDSHQDSAWVGFMYMSNFLGSDSQHRAAVEDSTYMGIGGTAGNFRITEYYNGAWYQTGVKIVVDDTYYWFKLEKIGTSLYIDVYTTEVLRDAEGNGNWYDNELVLHEDHHFRYFYTGISLDTNQALLVNLELYDVSMNGTMAGYATSGNYYTVNILGGDPAIAIIYNLTIPAGCGATMEFSTDNVTWVDHNNQAGYDTLIAGYEALDLRDIYNGTTYRRVNMTSNGVDTPRMYQERFVMVTEVVSDGDTIIMGGSGVFWIILIIIVPIVAYMVNKK